MSAMFETRIHIVFGEYLDRLRAQERRKPEDERREVPTAATIAAGIRRRHPRSNIHPITVSNIINGKRERLTLIVVQLILDEVHHAGFDAAISDFVEYRAPGEF